MQTATSNTIPQSVNAGIISDSHFSLKILFSSDEPAKLGKQYQFSTTAIAKNKITINSREEIVINSVLDICITDNHSKEPFNLTADVKKCNSSTTSSGYDITLQLKTRTDTHTDLEKWQRLIKVIK
ncbi:MAG: hypothetical protein OEY36_03205 [Gammaproteobacteria bacterium]|nr:hypothetical protein [Gammaproteobacteria bacterium]